MRRLAAILLLSILAAGCTSTSRRTVAPGQVGRAGSAPALASLPSGCDGVAPAASAVLTFVAQSRAWSVAPDDPSTLHCLFAVTDPGGFSWGPRGDRVVLSGLEVRGVGTNLSRPAAGLQPSYFSWSRPTGTTVVFTDQAQRKMFRADLGTAATRDITPVPGVTYSDMAYHPSGLAIGFVTSGKEGSAISMSTNQGQSPLRLVTASSPETTFGHVVFAHDGIGLFYSADMAAGTHMLARYDLPAGKAQSSLWVGGAPINDIIELAGAPGVALTVGSQCADRRALFSALDGSAGRALSTGAPGPESVVGRLDADSFVVATGGCNGSSDLYLVHLSGRAPALLARSVAAAALRIPEPTPPPPLPANLPRSGFA